MVLMNFRKGVCKHLSRLHLCAIVCLTCLVYYLLCHTEYGSTTVSRFWLSNECEKQTFEKGHNHTILMWTTYFSDVDPNPSVLHQLKCPHCHITTDRSLWSKSSAVVLHWRGIKYDPEPFPPRTGDNCPILVLYNRESPEHTPIELIESIKSDVDWVASYRRDSDLYAPYGWTVKRYKDGPYELPDLKTKQTPVCWLVSNCKSSSNREHYVTELQRHISIEQYGKCNNVSCPFQNTLDCYTWLSTRCKFYLAFENSICKEYVTEKLYNSLMVGMVPIVMGGNDYKNFLPNHSFIDVADFEEVKDLAQYLLDLDRDDRKYLEYLEWRKTLVVEFELYKWICDLCQKLQRTKKVKPRSDFVTWWYDGGKCKSNNSLTSLSK